MTSLSHCILTGGLENGLRVGGKDVGLVGNDRLELVVDDLDSIELNALRLDDIDDRAGFGEGGDVLADLVEAEDNVLAQDTAELSLGLVTQDDELGFRLLLNGTASELGNAAVDTTAKTTVRGGSNEQGLGILGSSGLSTLVQSYCNTL